MEYGTFVVYTIVGGVSWVTLVTLLGYFLGHIIPNIDTYILPIVALAVIVPLSASLVTIAIDAMKRRKQ